MSTVPTFRPKLLDCLTGYNSTRFFDDLSAGIIVAMVALPLAMGFAISSGAKPETGLYTAIIAGFIISALGGSRVQIGGPTGAFVPILFAIISNEKLGFGGLMVCTIIAGMILVVMGLCKLGSVIKYIPDPVTVGFTNGIGLIIFFQQLKDFLGLHIAGKMPAAFFPKLLALAEHINTINWWALGVSATTLIFILVWPPSWTRRVPGTIVALVLATVISHYGKFPIDTLGSVFGGIPTGLPSFQLPHLDINWQDPITSIEPLLYPALTIALLCAIESLLSAVVADGVIDDHHNSNQEIIAQGIANIICPFFGGIPATGAIARTATNIRSGATSPVAGMIHAIVLLIIILVAAPLATNIPLAALSAILIRVAYNIGEWSAFIHLNRIPRSDAAVLVITFILTVIVDLNIAVGVGMMLACLLFIKRISEMTKVSLLSEEKPRDGRTDASKFDIPKDILVFNVFGALMFGAAEKLETLLQHTRQEPCVLVLRMGDVLAMDATAMKVLQSIYTKLRRRNKWLVLSGPHTQPYMLLESSGFLDELGHDNVQADFSHALERAKYLKSLSKADSVAAAKAPRG